jgi:hypothetical protein
MNVEANKKLVLDAYSALAAGNVEAYLSCLAENIQYTFFGNHRFARTYSGKMDLITHLFVPVSDLLEGGVNLRIDNVIAEGDQVVLEVQGEAQTKTGLVYNNSYCVVIKIMQQKIVEVREYMDTELAKSIFG